MKAETITGEEKAREAGQKYLLSNVHDPTRYTDSKTHTTNSGAALLEERYRPEYPLKILAGAG